VSGTPFGFQFGYPASPVSCSLDEMKGEVSPMQSRTLNEVAVQDCEGVHVNGCELAQQGETMLDHFIGQKAPASQPVSQLLQYSHDRPTRPCGARMRCAAEHLLTQRFRTTSSAMNARGGPQQSVPAGSRRAQDWVVAIGREEVMVPVAVLSDPDRASRGAGKCPERSGVS